MKVLQTRLQRVGASVASEVKRRTLGQLGLVVQGELNDVLSLGDDADA